MKRACRERRENRYYRIAGALDRFVCEQTDDGLVYLDNGNGAVTFLRFPR